LSPKRRKELYIVRMLWHKRLKMETTMSLMMRSTILTKSKKRRKRMPFGLMRTKMFMRLNPSKTTQSPKIK
jgi:hypothetical protein